MKLTVSRCWFSPVSVMGVLDIDACFQAYTLENADPSELIPCGVYPLRLLPSEKFGRYMPFICNVPGHTADEIHIGNSIKDVKGCTCIGETRGADWVGNSVTAFNELMSKLDASQEMEIEYLEERAISA
jgi:hypothetical protein